MGAKQKGNCAERSLGVHSFWVLIGENNKPGPLLGFFGLFPLFFCWGAFCSYILLYHPVCLLVFFFSLILLLESDSGHGDNHKIEDENFVGCTAPWRVGIRISILFVCFRGHESCCCVLCRTKRRQESKKKIEIGKKIVCVRRKKGKKFFNKENERSKKR